MSILTFILGLILGCFLHPLKKKLYRIYFKFKKYNNDQDWFGY